MPALLGYKVTTARFEPSRKKVWYVVGSPRASNLLGNVSILFPEFLTHLLYCMTLNWLGTYAFANNKKKEEQ